MIRTSNRFYILCLGIATFAACSSSEDRGIVLDQSGSGGTASGGDANTGGSLSKGGTANSGGGGRGGSAGRSEAGAEPGGAGSFAGGAANAGSSGEGGTLDGAAGAVSAELCIFHTDAPDPSELPEPEPEPEAAGGSSGAAGAGGAGPEYDISLKVSPFVGPFLADNNGKSLYIYGADFPGDCETDPVSNCVDDCLMAWPLFDAGPRELDPGLDDAPFGRIQRDDGEFQTTFYGWPLYYYRSDLEPGQLNGQGRGKIWFAAETVLPNVMIMRAPEALGGMRYLGDERGRTLYVFEEDEAGSSANPPVSHCTDGCLDDFAIFTRAAVLPVSSLEPADLTVFFREDGRSQIAYRGQPLYVSAADTKSGEMNGLETDGWSLIVQ